MTSQTRTFIEMSDIVALRLECKQCHCSLLITADTEDKTFSALVDKYNAVLSKCPTCGTAWTQFNAPLGAFDHEIKEFFRAMAYLRKIEGNLGCKLPFECLRSRRQINLPPHPLNSQRGNSLGLSD
jgi:hypothetical protein